MQPPGPETPRLVPAPALGTGCFAGLAMGLQFSMPQFPCLFPLLILNPGTKLCLRILLRRLNEMVGVKA